MNNQAGGHKRAGFEGQKMIVIPPKIITRIASYPFINSLFITDIGYFPKARLHYRERPKGINQYILIYCTEGEGWFKFEGNRCGVKPDYFFLLPPGCSHAYGAERKNPWSIYWVHFESTMGNSLYSDLLSLDKPLHQAVAHIHERSTIFNEMYNTLKRGYSLKNIGYANSCLWHFIGSFIFNNIFFNNKTSDSPSPIEESISWMQQHLDEQISLNDLAQKTHYSVSHYSMLFAEETGYAPIEYFIHLKIQRACQYLDLTEFRIKKIANLVGYEDPYYFSRLFKKVLGVAPTKYRKREKG